MVESSVNAYAEHGFNYNLTNIDFSNILNKGSQEAIDQWKTLPLSTPGLFNLPVCEVPGLEFIPGGDQVQIDVSRLVSFPIPHPEPIHNDESSCLLSHRWVTITATITKIPAGASSPIPQLGLAL